MEKQTTIYAYPDMAMCGTTSESIGLEKDIHFYDGGWYLSDIYDSGHMGMYWDRLFLQGNLHSINVDIWVEDHREKLLHVQEADISIEPIIRSVYPHVLLKQAQGRYLRFRLCIPSNEVASLSGFKIVYPYRSHVELFPQLYQDNEDLHLFMAPLEDAFLALQNEIRQLPRMWNPEVASYEQLLEMVTFLNLEMLLHEDVDTLRTLLIHNHKWIQQRGTYEALFFLATVVLKRNVLFSVEDAMIHMIAVFHDEEEARHIEALLTSQIAFGVNLHITWIMDGRMDASYLDLEMYFDRKTESVFDMTYMGEQIWL